MAIFAIPKISTAVRRDLDELEAMRRTLSERVEAAESWTGALRRSVRAAAVRGSTSIEGFSVAPEEAARLVAGEGAQPSGDDQLAVACYARAMDHVVAMARDPGFRWLDRVVLDLHFDVCWFQPDKRPGRWRSGPIGVTAADGTLEFRGPDANRVPDLMEEVVDSLATADKAVDVVVRAAMAHLNLISVHPFADGNGRVARIVQSLVLARDGHPRPELFSIEQYLGNHTARYYSALRETQGGGFHPERDATPWIEFCVEAHLAQARERLEQVARAAVRWDRLEDLAATRGWPGRVVIALEQALTRGTDRGRYAAEAEISAATASADLRRLLDAGLVSQSGRARSTAYAPTAALREAAG
jgi:Fic family protein